MSLRINVRNFTGTTIPLDIQPTQTVTELKEALATSGKGKAVRVPTLVYKGHELRDSRQIQHYDIASKDTVHILPPSKVEKITLSFEKEDGTRFSLSVNSNIKIDQLKREISIEEKVNAKQLKVVSTQEDPDGDAVVTLKDLDDTAVLSTLSLEDEIIAVYTSIRENPTGPFAFGVLLSIDDRLEDTEKNLMGVAVKSDQTLGLFKEDILNKHCVLLTDYTLILIGRELKDDGKTLGDLGFIPGCTVHAVANVQFCVSTPTSGDFDMAVGPMTRVSAIRKMLEEVDKETNYDEYWFTLDGMDNLKESRTFWDLDIVSGTMILLKKRCYVTLTIRRQLVGTAYNENRNTFDITADESDTIEGLKQRILAELGLSGQLVSLNYRLKVLNDSKTLKQEKLEGGEVLDAVFAWAGANAGRSMSGFESTGDGEGGPVVPLVDSADFGEAPGYTTQ